MSEGSALDKSVHKLATRTGSGRSASHSSVCCRASGCSGMIIQIAKEFRRLHCVPRGRSRVNTGCSLECTVLEFWKDCYDGDVGLKNIEKHSVHPRIHCNQAGMRGLCGVTDPGGCRMPAAGFFIGWRHWCTCGLKPEQRSLKAYLLCIIRTTPARVLFIDLKTCWHGRFVKKTLYWRRIWLNWGPQVACLDPLSQGQEGMDL